MHYAVQTASAPTIKLLLLYNADINAQDRVMMLKHFYIISESVSWLVDTLVFFYSGRVDAPARCSTGQKKRHRETSFDKRG